MRNNSIKYGIQGNIASDKQGYSTLANLYQVILSSSLKSIILDFTELRWIDANLASVLGAIINNLRSKDFLIKLENIPPNISNAFLRNGFLNMTNTYSATNNAETVMSYWEFNITQDDFFYRYIRDEILAKDCFPRCSDRLQKELTRNIFELYSNACIHGDTQYVFTCGQHYPQKNPAKLDFTIVNIGNTIMSNVNNYLSIYGKDLLSPHESIKWATVEKNSTKINRSGGLGLSLLINFIKLNQGKIQIVSDKGFWEFHNGMINNYTTSIDYPFPGVIVTLEFNVSNTNDFIYQFKDEQPTSISNLF